MRHKSAALIRADDERFKCAVEAHVRAHLGRECLECSGRNGGGHVVRWVEATVPGSSVDDAGVAGEAMKDARD